MELDLPKLALGNQKPETRNQKPETRNQKPETRNQKPETAELRLCQYIFFDRSIIY